MFQLLPKLFTSPRSAWLPIREHAEQHPWGFLPVLLVLSVIPAICAYIGTAHVGWELFGSEDPTYLNQGSALYLACMVYLGFLCGVSIMALMTRWVLFRTPGRPTLLLAYTFATCLSVPLMLASIGAVIPVRMMLLLFAVLGTLYSIILLFRGLPVFMHLKRNDETRFYGACILAVGFLVFLTNGFIFMELWWQPLSGGEYISEPAESDDFSLP
ncbi:Yip1 family protein [Pseudomonas profundi]|uniref:Yip1 family protein n=1 Tax=Pseudomonas profundi TaxID=1981513 RepID=UPI00123973BE|nr:Yip1 family protein [Pseudomonas profundi]